MREKQKSIWQYVDIEYEKQNILRGIFYSW